LLGSIPYLACHQRPADTIAEFPALCIECLDRAGTDIEAACAVVCTVGESCGGMVDRLEDDGQYAIVRTHSGKKAWLPIQEVVRVLPPY